MPPVPIAISIRASNTYEDNTVGKYGQDASLHDTQTSKTYLMTHMRNQLSFDLWYIFLGVFCIIVAEAGPIADHSRPEINVFSILFECTSAYANVGLSLGYPSGSTSLSGLFSVFSKVVVCALMIRGRHRGLPYALDRAITLPKEEMGDLGGDGDWRRLSGKEMSAEAEQGHRLKKSYTH